MAKSKDHRPSSSGRAPGGGPQEEKEKRLEAVRGDDDCFSRAKLGSSPSSIRVGWPSFSPTKREANGATNSSRFLESRKVQWTRTPGSLFLFHIPRPCVLQRAQNFQQNCLHRLDWCNWHKQFYFTLVSFFLLCFILFSFQFTLPYFSLVHFVSFHFS